MSHLSWFATIDGTVLGPTSPAQFHVLVERGWIRAETPVRHERMKRAVPAAQVHGLPPLRHSPPRLRAITDESVRGPECSVLNGLVLFLAGVASALVAVLALIA